MKAIRCPRCRGVDIYLREHIVCYGEWSPGDDKAINTEGRYFKVTGVCSCNHEWTLKGEIQMNDNLKERLRINKLLIDAAEVKDFKSFLKRRKVCDEK